ncbi:MAG: glycoside hydrolase family 43 protein [Mangrovibacterium sp.]
MKRLNYLFILVMLFSSCRKQAEDDFAAYLMVFHQDETHSLHMALSYDGYSFTALNDCKPIIAGDTIAKQMGIRDPHIFRHEGEFYLAMTDLHIYAQQAGYRETEWERPGELYGWGNNRGLVLMKSNDLIHWTRANVDFSNLSSKYGDVGCVWAPEVIYDDKAKKMMVYFTMRFGVQPSKLYYIYLNDDFNQIESMPEVLYEYPDTTKTAIDADITKVGDKYRMFYVAHDGIPGIKQATSDRINGDYQYDSRWFDSEQVACEAPNVWKRNGENKWVLMYDVYGKHPHNFGFRETTDFKHFTDLGNFNEGVMKTTNFQSPKHGAVISITKAEAERLEEKYSQR